MIGRYGTIAFATVTVLVGLGVFLNWAIANGYLGPTARVAAGYAAALVLAAIGVRLRLRGTRDFGNVLLAMALGVVHLVCWSAGPLLHVLPSAVALGIGFVASVLLAEFALRHDEEMLCATGIGGAIIAPFVASDSTGSRVALAIYGVIVIALAAAALGNRPWRVARWIIIAGLALYTLAPEQRWLVITPVLILAALVPASPALHRRVLLRAGAVALIGGALRRADLWPGDWIAVAVTAAGAAIALGALEASRHDALEQERVGRPSDRLVDGFLIPVGLWIGTMSGLREPLSLPGGEIAALFAACLIWLTWRNRAEPVSVPMAAAAAVIAAWIAPAALDGRIRYEYLPFATVPSLIVGLQLAALVVVLRRYARPDELRRTLAGGAIALAFLWGRWELQGAGSHTIAASLLVVYYAASGALMTWFGRRKSVRALRIIGLALSLWAAIQALIQTFSIPNVAARVAVFFAVSGFLIVVGYWYRRSGESDTGESRTTAP